MVLWTTHQEDLALSTPFLGRAGLDATGFVNSFDGPIEAHKMCLTGVKTVIPSKKIGFPSKISNQV